MLPRFQSRQGTLSWVCLDYWSAELRIDILQLKSDLEHLIQVRPQALDFLAHIEALGTRAILVTNAHEKLLVLKLARTKIARYFHAIVSAHGYGRPKEDVEFWDRLHREYAYDPDRTLLIDDNLDVLRAAAGEFGIRHLYTVEQPDSHAPRRAASEFPAISSFDSVLKPLRPYTRSQLRSRRRKPRLSNFV